jgi:hypothetical protein
MGEREWGRVGMRTNIVDGCDERVGFQVCCDGGFVFKSSCELCQYSRRRLGLGKYHRRHQLLFLGALLLT